MFDIQKIDCKPGDVILFLFDYEHYDIPACHEIFKVVEKQFSNNTVIALPKDLVADIKIFDTQPKSIEINGDNTITNIFQEDIKQYLNDYYSSDSITFKPPAEDKGWIIG